MILPSALPSAEYLFSALNLDREDTDLKIKTLVLHECPLWKNATIGRELDRKGIQIVMEDFVRSGHGEWEDPELRTRCRIMWRKPEQLASDIYDWAVANGFINSVCTVYELHSGEWKVPFRRQM